MRLHRSLLVLLLLTTSACSPAGSDAQPGDAPGGAAAADAGAPDDAGPSEACVRQAAKLAAALDAGRIAAQSPGSAAAVLTPECGLWEGASGTSTEKEPLTSRHLSWIGSVTKTFVSETVLRLAESNKLGLDDTLAKYVASFPGASGITLRQMLSHQSGIYNYTDDTDFQNALSRNPGRVWKPEELVAYAAAHPPDFAPGQGWAYSNTNYVLLAMIVQQVTGGPLAAALRAQAFVSAGLTETFFDKEPTIHGPRAHGFDTAGDDVTDMIDMSFALGAGGVISTPTDLVKWSQALYEGRLLAAPSMQALLTFRDAHWPDGMQYGLGAMQFPARTTGAIALGHGGDQPGYHTWMLYFPDRRMAVAAYVNSDGADRFRVTQALLGVLEGSRPAFE